MSAYSDYGVTNVIGVAPRPLGDYSARQKQLQTAYDIALQLAATDAGNTIYADIDPYGDGDITLAQGDPAVAMTYGLKPYIVAPRYEAASLVSQVNVNGTPMLLGNHIQPDVLKAIVKRIVEEA